MATSPIASVLPLPAQDIPRQWPKFSSCDQAHVQYPLSDTSLGFSMHTNQSRFLVNEFYNGISTILESQCFVHFKRHFQNTTKHGPKQAIVACNCYLSIRVTVQDVIKK